MWGDHTRVSDCQLFDQVCADASPVAMWFAKLDNLTNQVAYAALSILRQTMPAEGKEPPPMAARSLKVGVQASF